MWFQRRRTPNVGNLRKRLDLVGLRAAAEFRDVALDRQGRVLDLGAPIRAHAVTALSELDGAGSIQALARALHDGNPTVRLAAVRGLRELRSQASDDVLIDFLAGGAAQRTPETAAEALGAVLTSGRDGLPERFAVRVVALRIDPVDDSDRRVFGALAAADVRSDWGDSVFEALLPFLHAEDRPQREQAERVQEWCAADAADPLVGALEAGEPSGAIVRLAGATGDQRTLLPLMGLVDHSDPGIRRDAAVALGRVKDARAVEPLLYMTRDPALPVREAALAALDSLGVAAVAVGLAVLVRSMLPAGALDSAWDGGVEAPKWVEGAFDRLLEAPAEPEPEPEADVDGDAEAASLGVRQAR